MCIPVITHSQCSLEVLSYIFSYFRCLNLALNKNFFYPRYRHRCLYGQVISVCMAVSMSRGSKHVQGMSGAVGVLQHQRASRGPFACFYIRDYVYGPPKLWGSTCGRLPLMPWKGKQ